MPKGSYDINAGGTGSPIDPLGPGWRWKGLVNDVHQAVAEADVVVPSDLVVLGDALIPQGVTYSDSQFNFRNYQLNPNSGRRDEQRALERRRHGGRFNVACGDGHVEALGTNRLFQVNPEVTRRWNRDHEPHVTDWR